MRNTKFGISKFTALAIGALASLISLSSYQAMAGDHGNAHWGYAGAEGPQNWSGLSDNYTACASGRVQSPVNLENGLAAEFGRIESHFFDGPLRVVNNGHTVQFNSSGGNVTSFGGDEYQLLQVHFHSPSENALYGKRFPMEAHMVHQNSDGELAVLAVFMQEGHSNAFVQDLWDHAPATINQEAVVQQSLLNPANILPNNSDYFHFKGSLTTPPCSEGVSWYVLKTPVDVSSTQVNQFVSLIGANARPVQRMNGRSVYSVQGGEFSAPASAGSHSTAAANHH